MDSDEFDLFWSEPIKDLDGCCSRLLDDGADEFDLFWSEPIKDLDGCCVEHCPDL